MESHFGDTTQIASILKRLQAGDEKARDELLERSQRRLRYLAEKIAGLNSEEVLSGANWRLIKALPEVRPASVVDFMRWAACQMRRELIDLARRNPPQPIVVDPADSTAGPVGQVLCTEFHELIAKMKEKERDLFDLLYYAGLTVAEVADQLDVSESTIRKRWNKAKLSLHRELNK